jgi:hypothetical protein
LLRITGLPVGSLFCSRTLPRTSGWSTHGEIHSPWAVGSPCPSSTIWTGAMWNCTQGPGDPDSMRTKPPPSARFDVSGPLWVASNSSSAAGSSASSSDTGSGVVHTP